MKYNKLPNKALHQALVARGLAQTLALASAISRRDSLPAGLGRAAHS